MCAPPLRRSVKLYDMEGLSRVLSRIIGNNLCCIAIVLPTQRAEQTDRLNNPYFLADMLYEAWQKPGWVDGDMSPDLFPPKSRTQNDRERQRAAFSTATETLVADSMLLQCKSFGTPIKKARRMSISNWPDKRKRDAQENVDAVTSETRVDHRPAKKAKTMDQDAEKLSKKAKTSKISKKKASRKPLL
ncbi:hypothetical protein PsYK624_082430 [Phanerochaete sordida]|uniref:Uncharacterized protein n=1 Tax=Phanerochaete sordida TaxID=48140 RepID=A0A9P3GCE1_9APHY|nr:hypothetical protein PsYK624_082430 [Phanerochaete sordida]